MDKLTKQRQKCQRMRLSYIFICSSIFQEFMARKRDWNINSRSNDKFLFGKIVNNIYGKGTRIQI